MHGEPDETGTNPGRRAGSRACRSAAWWPIFLAAARRNRPARRVMPRARITPAGEARRRADGWWRTGSSRWSSPGGPGDRGSARSSSSGPGVGESFLVVTELTQGAGREDLPEPRLAEIDVGGRVPTKMLGHHHFELRDLLVQRGDDADLADDNGPRRWPPWSRDAADPARAARPTAHRPWSGRDAGGPPAMQTPPGLRVGLAARVGDGARPNKIKASVADRSSKASTAAGKYSRSVDLSRRT